MRYFFDNTDFSSKRILCFSPHPDDISISMGALAYVTWLRGGQVEMVLMTNGSEALIPDDFLISNTIFYPQYGNTAVNRGKIRVDEASREATILNIKKLFLLEKQTWHTRHLTPSIYLDGNEALLDVFKYVPNQITLEAIEECAAVIEGSEEKTIVALPFINDKLIMHSITTNIVLHAIDLLYLKGKHVDVLFYFCLSTNDIATPLLRLYFDEEIMQIKSNAINAHISMKRRREVQGGYANGGVIFYDEILRKENSVKDCENILFFEEFYKVDDRQSFMEILTASNMEIFTIYGN